MWDKNKPVFLYMNGVPSWEQTLKLDFNDMNDSFMRKKIVFFIIWKEKKKYILFTKGKRTIYVIYVTSLCVYVFFF
jgi:hypothetical protein